MTRNVANHREATDAERVFREVYGQAVATLVRLLADITLAEDAVQDAFVVASDRWPRDGIPPNPAGSIVTTARNRAIDDLRRSARGRELQEQLDLVPHASHGPAAGAVWESLRPAGTAQPWPVRGPDQSSFSVSSNQVA